MSNFGRLRSHLRWGPADIRGSYQARAATTIHAALQTPDVRRRSPCTAVLRKVEWQASMTVLCASVMLSCTTALVSYMCSAPGLSASVLLFHINLLLHYVSLLHVLSLFLYNVFVEQVLGGCTAL